MSKTIEVSDEMHEKLMQLSHEINNQNHRGTAMPYIFQVEEEVRINGVENADDFEWMTEDAESFGSDMESIREQLEVDGHDIPKGMQAEFDGQEEMFDIFQVDELLTRLGYWKNNYRIEHKYTNAFLTEKACKRHIEQNSYHYNEPKDYLSSANRNYELELVFQFLCGLTGRDIHK